jgi:chromate transporter
MTASPQSAPVQDPGNNSRPPPPVSLGGAFWYWLRLGFISFGGPAGQIAIMHQDLVERRRWISDRRFLHALNYCMVLPGPEAQQLATYIGWLMHKTGGGLLAGTLFVLPSLFILIGLSWIYMSYGSAPVVAGILYGVKPAVTAVVVFAAYRIGSRALKNGVLLAIAAAAFLAIFALGMPFPLIIITAGVLGYVGGRIAPAKFATGGGHDAVGRRYGAALIDDDTPTPPHALFTWRRLARVCATGGLLWGAAITFLIARFGLDGTLAQMGWFFTKAALLTFGGAYAVLPYVYQGGVEHYGWLTATQMIDGLALGETTPGPLIMVVAFVGFVGGWSTQLFGADSALLAGCLAATVVTYFTFLPSFLFIFAGAPLIETTHGNLKFTAPLTGITAAVVGVVINLAVFFAWKVLWPRASEAAPFGGAFEWPTLILGIAAAVALFRYRVGIVPVIAGCGLLGLLYTAIAGLHGA